MFASKGIQTCALNLDTPLHGGLDQIFTVAYKQPKKMVDDDVGLCMLGIVGVEKHW